MTTRNPTDEELTGYDDIDLSDSDFSYIPNNKEDTEEKALAVLYFYRLYQFYTKYNDKTPEYVLSHIDEDIQKLRIQLLKSTDKDVAKYIKNIRSNILAKYKLNSSIKECQVDYSTTVDVLDETIKTILEQLKSDAKMKVRVWKDRNYVAKDFNLKPNFKRAINRLNQGFRYTTNTLSQKTDRTIQKFVYKTDKFVWVCYGRHPCGWCIDQSKIPPRLIDEIPYDHINGYCGVEPSDTKYSTEYLDYVGEIE